MNSFSRSTVCLIVVLFVVIIIGNLLPSTVTRPTYDSGCYCHNQGVAIYVNGTDTNAPLRVNIPYLEISGGASFALLIRTEQAGPVGLVPGAMVWMTNRSDNERFRFDPQEVVDNSPRDTDPGVGKIATLFRIVAPKEAGSYSIVLYAQGPFLPFEVTVTKAIINTYDVAVSLAGLPTAVQAVLLVDGSKLADMKGGESKFITYPAGTSHSFQVDQYVDGAAGYRYYCALNSWTASAAGSNVFNYQTQVYLDVSTEPTGVTDATPSGWFATGSSVSISPVPAEVQGVKGTKYVFTGWTMDGAPKAGNGFAVIMDAPHKLVARFDATTPIQTSVQTSVQTLDHFEVYIGASAAIVSAVIVLLRRRRAKHSVHADRAVHSN